MRAPCAAKSGTFIYSSQKNPTHIFLSIKPAPEPGTTKLIHGPPGRQVQGGVRVRLMASSVQVFPKSSIFLASLPAAKCSWLHA